MLSLPWVSKLTNRCGTAVLSAAIHLNCRVPRVRAAPFGANLGFTVTDTTRPAVSAGRPSSRLPARQRPC